MKFFNVFLFDEVEDCLLENGVIPAESRDKLIQMLKNRYNSKIMNVIGEIDGVYIELDWEFP